MQLANWDNTDDRPGLKGLSCNKTKQFLPQNCELFREYKDTVESALVDTSV